MTISMGNNRLILDKKKDISQFCKNDGLSIDNIEHHRYEEKKLIEKIFNRHYNLNAKTETDSTANKDDINKKLKGTKFIRFIKRFTFDFGDYKCEFSIIKESPYSVKSFTDCNLFNQPEKYEVEIEILKPAETEAEDKATEIQRIRDHFNQCISKYPHIIENDNYKTQKDTYKELVYSVFEKASGIDGDGKNNLLKNIFRSERDYFLNPKPVSMSHNDVFNIFNGNHKDGKKMKDHYTITDKADGESRLMYINNTGDCYFIDNMLNFYDAKITLNSNDDYKNSLFNGEFIYHNDQWIYAIFDVYFKDNGEIYNKNLDERYKIIKGLKGDKLVYAEGDNNKKINIIYKKFYHYEKENRQEKKLTHFEEDDPNVVIRKMSDLIDNNDSIYTVDNEQILLNTDTPTKNILEYKIDGIIYTTDSIVGDSHTRDTDIRKLKYIIDKVGINEDNETDNKIKKAILDFNNLKKTWSWNLKWKPSHENTIDFLVKEETEDTIINGQVKQIAKIYRGIGTKETGSIPYKYKNFLLYCGDKGGYSLFKPTSPQMNNSHIASIRLENDKAICLDGSIIQNNQIVEFSFDTILNQWIPNRVRVDKSRLYLDQYRKRESLWNDYQNIDKFNENQLMRFKTNFTSTNRELRGKPNIKEMNANDFKKNFGHYFVNSEEIKGFNIQDGPNFITTCEAIWKTFNNPITIKMILEEEAPKVIQTEESKVGYWGDNALRRNEDPMINMRKFNNDVKRRILEKYSKKVIDNIDLLDMSCGQGGDLFKFKDIQKIKNVVGCDIDPKAITEAKRRYNNLFLSNNKGLEKFSIQVNSIEKYKNNIEYSINDFLNKKYGKSAIVSGNIDMIHNTINNSISIYSTKINNCETIEELDNIILFNIFKDIDGFINGFLKDKINCKFFVLDSTNDWDDQLFHESTEKYEEWIKSTSNKFDLVICNFAFHYFLKNKITLNTAINNIKTNLKNGERFICTVLDGKKINDMFKEKDQIIGSKDGINIWEINKNYNVQNLDDNENSLGLEIKVKLSSTGVVHTEYILNIDYIKTVFSQNDFDCEGEFNFSDYYSEKFNLSQSEKDYSFLSKVLVFTKKDMTKNNIINEIIENIVKDEQFDKKMDDKSLKSIIRKNKKSLVQYFNEIYTDQAMIKEQIDIVTDFIFNKIRYDTNDENIVIFNNLFSMNTFDNIRGKIIETFTDLLSQKTSLRDEIIEFLSGKINTLKFTRFITNKFEKTEAEQIIEFYNNNKKILLEAMVNGQIILD